MFEGDGRELVPEHTLHELDVRAAAHSESGGCVVEMESRHDRGRDSLKG